MAAMVPWEIHSGTTTIVFASQLSAAWHAVSLRILAHNGSRLNIGEIFDTFERFHQVCDLCCTLDNIALKFRPLAAGGPSDIVNPALVSHYFGVWAASKERRHASFSNVIMQLLGLLRERGSIYYSLPSALHGAIWQAMFEKALQGGFPALVSSAQSMCSKETFSSFPFDRFEYAALHECLHGVGHGAFYGVTRLSGLYISGRVQLMPRSINFTTAMLWKMSQVCTSLVQPSIIERCLSGVNHAVWQFGQHKKRPIAPPSVLSKRTAAVRPNKQAYATREHVEHILIPKLSSGQSPQFRSDAAFGYQMVKPFLLTYRRFALERRNCTLQNAPRICSWCSLLDTFQTASLTFDVDDLLWNRTD